MNKEDNLGTNKHSSKEVVRVRLSTEEYKKLEQVCLTKNGMREVTEGSLGVRVGVELVLRELRNGFVHE